MGGESDYGGVQQPPGPYSPDAGTDGYVASQNPAPDDAEKSTAAAQPTFAQLGNGVNLQPSYTAGGDVDLGWSLMRQQPKIKSVRIEIEPGMEAQAQRWISEAISNKYAVVATYHNYKKIGSPDEPDLLDAANWWAKNYAALSSSGPFLLNLMNEWGHQVAPHDFATAYNKAIQVVRSVYDGQIIVDAPGYGQDAGLMYQAIRGTNNARIGDPKLILSMHIYPESWNHAANRPVTVDDLDLLKSTGLPCMIGEFGESDKELKTEWADIVSYARQVGWPVLGWAWNGDGGIMNMIEPAFQQRGGPIKPYQKISYFDVIYQFL